MYKKYVRTYYPLSDVKSIAIGEGLYSITEFDFESKLICANGWANTIELAWKSAAFEVAPDYDTNSQFKDYSGIIWRVDGHTDSGNIILMSVADEKVIVKHDSWFDHCIVYGFHPYTPPIGITKYHFHGNKLIGCSGGGVVVPEQGLNENELNVLKNETK